MNLSRHEQRAELRRRTLKDRQTSPNPVAAECCVRGTRHFLEISDIGKTKRLAASNAVKSKVGLPEQFKTKSSVLPTITVADNNFDSTAAIIIAALVDRQLLPHLVISFPDLNAPSSYFWD